jgi:hypothetical protein
MPFSAFMRKVRHRASLSLVLAFERDPGLYGHVYGVVHTLRYRNMPV